MSRKIIGIAGSLRPGSVTCHAIQQGLQLIEESGWEIELLDLREMTLPFCDSSREYPDFPDVQRLREAVQSADGILLGTPEYHGSLSGVLKNCLDLLENSDVEGKVFAVLSVLGGSTSMNAVNHVRTICRQLHAWTVPEQLLIPNSQKAFDSEGTLVDPVLKGRLQELVSSLCANAEKLR